MFKKFLSYIFVASIIVSNITTPISVSANAPKSDYVILKQTDDTVVVETKEMTTQEANLKQSEDGVVFVEKDSLVYGSSKDKKQKAKDKKQKHTKKTKKYKSKDLKEEWNMKAINAEKPTSNIEINTESNIVKVAIIDSGIDLSDDIDVYKRNDFICDTNDDMFVLFEDLSGHGTSVAGIIAAKDNNEGITGINPNVQLYSARVLDVNLSSPISRVVDAIYWAIDEGVNIINISFGTTTNSEILHKAIKDANDANILVIAAAGNNGIVEYPAAYDEVMAVGSVNSLGEVSDASAQGDKLDIVAPGEQVMSTGAFDGVAVLNGTSMAAPHVSGVASVLWQKDLSCTNDFIRQLINYSANLYGNKNEYGNGLVDLNFALEQYDSFKELYTEIATAETIVPIDELENNETIIPIFEDVDYVTGTWAQATHKTIVDNATSIYSLTSDQLKILKLGAIWQDQDGTKELSLNSEIAGITNYPQFHGYYTANYLASYIYLTMVANNYGDTTSYSYMPSGMNIFSTSKVKNVSYTSISSLINDGYKRKLFIWGMALHQATDIYAHSSYKYDSITGKYIRIKHDSYFKSSGYDADDTNISPARYEAAKQVAKNSIAHYFTNTPGTVGDFALSTTYYNGTFYLYQMNTFASNVKASNSALNKVDLVYNTSNYEIK